MAIAAAKLSLAVEKADVGKTSGVPAPSTDFAKKLNHAIQKTDKSEDSSTTSDSQQAQNKPQKLPDEASDAPAKASDVSAKKASDTTVEKGQTKDEVSQPEDSSPANAQKPVPQTPTVPTAIPVQQTDQTDDDQYDAPADKPAKATAKPQQPVIPNTVIIQQQPVQPKVPNPQNTPQQSSDQEKKAPDVLASDKKLPPANVNANATNGGDPIVRGKPKQPVATKQAVAKDSKARSDNNDDSQAQDSAPVQDKTLKPVTPQPVVQAPEAQSQTAQSADSSSPADTSDSKQTSPKLDFAQVMQMRMPEQPAQTSTTQVTPSATPQSQNINIQQAFIDTNHPQIISGVRGQLMPHGGTLQLRLDPPELGAMNVTMKIADGTVTASFQTTNPEATRLLSHSLADLKNGLESAGVSVDKLHVTQVSHDQMSSNDFDQRGGNQQSSGQQGTSQQQDQQRREMMRRLWRKVSGGDPLDLVA